MGNARSKTKPTEWNDTPAVDEFLSRLKHPLKPIVEAVRNAILDTDSCITEGIKWNAPSFYCNGWFATANARGKEVIVVLHLGAKVKDNSTPGISINDRTGLLEWPAKERALVRIRDIEEFSAKRAAFSSVIKQWVNQMPSKQAA